MELNAVKKGEKSLLLECRGETVTLTNLLREYLWDNPSVTESAQVKERPYLTEPKIWVKVSRGFPITAIERVTSVIEKDVKEFKEKFKAALKKKV